MLGYLSLEIICSSKLTVFARAMLSVNCSLLGTDNVRGQILAYFRAKLRLSFIYPYQIRDHAYDNAGYQCSLYGL